MLNSLKNKVAIVTGASDDLGKSVASFLAREGVRVALVARGEEKLRNTRKENEIDVLAKKLEILSHKILGIAHYVWGSSVSIEHLEKGYTHGFVMTFDTKEARDNYVPHPLHKELIKKFVDPICDDGLVFDIEE